MADNYLMFSDEIACLTIPEYQWLRVQLDPEALGTLSDLSYDIECGDDIEWSEDMKEAWGRRYEYVLWDYFCESECFGFSFEFEDEVTGGIPYYRSLWVYDDEYGDPDAVAILVQAFLIQFRPDDIWTLSWAYTCSKMCIGRFGGGAMLVTATEKTWTDTPAWLANRRRERAKNGRGPKRIEMAPGDSDGDGVRPRPTDPGGTIENGDRA